MTTAPAIGTTTYTNSSTGAHWVYAGAWNPNATYVGAYTGSEQNSSDLRASGGQEVSYAGAYWLASYYNSGADPLEANTTNSPGSPWILASTAPGGGSNTPNYAQVVPNAPTSLTSGYVSSSTVALFWDPAYVPGLGSVNSYEVFDNGNQIGTTTSTSFTATGLTAGSGNAFTVYAVDGSGVSTTAATREVYTTSAGSSGKYFSPFVDMTLPSTDLLSISQASGLRDFTLAFMQSDGLNSSGVPTISWGGVDPTKLPLSQGTMVAEIKAVEAEGGNVTISFGGYTGLDPAVEAATYAGKVGTSAAAANLQAEYSSVMSTYGVHSLDFDIEPDASGDILTNTAANTMLNTAIVGLEAANPGLKVTFTLAVSPSGLSAEDLSVLRGAVAAGVNINTVNIMAMDYNGSVPDMAQAAISAAKAAEAQLVALGLGATKIGITPMIGQNDTASNVTSPLDVQTLEAFAAQTPWVAGMGEWELPRDVAGTGSSANQGSTNAHPASSYNSNVTQTAYEFAGMINQIESAVIAGKSTTGKAVPAPAAGVAADTVTSVAHGSTFTPVASSGNTATAGTYGTLTVNAAGAYTYAATNGLAIVTAADGTPIVDTFADTVATPRAGVDYNPGAANPAQATSAVSEIVSLAAGGSEAVTNPSGTATFTIGATTLTINETTASTYGGIIEDGSSGNVGGNVVVAGSAALTLTRVSTYTGKTSVSGTLDLSGTASTLSSSGVTLTTSGATLDISGSTTGEAFKNLGGVAGTVVDLGSKNLKINVQTGAVDTFSGTIKDGGAGGGTGGSVTLGTLGGELTLAHANSYTGGTSIYAGTLDVAALGAVGSGTINFMNSASSNVATLEVNAAALTAVTPTVSGVSHQYSFANAIGGATSTKQVIDLTSLAYVQGSTSATLSGTTLNVKDGSSDVTLHLAVTQSKSSFTTASDGNGGTLVYDPPAAKHAAPAAKIDTHWIAMAMDGFGGVSGDSHTGTAAHDPYGLTAALDRGHAAMFGHSGSHSA